MRRTNALYKQMKKKIIKAIILGIILLTFVSGTLPLKVIPELYFKLEHGYTETAGYQHLNHGNEECYCGHTKDERIFCLMVEMAKKEEANR